MKKKEVFKVYVSKIRKEHYDGKIEFSMVVETNFPGYSFTVSMIDKMNTDDSMFISKFRSVGKYFLLTFLKENYPKKDKFQKLNVVYYFNHEYSANGSLDWIYDDHRELDFASIPSLKVPLTEREIILFLKGVTFSFLGNKK